MTAVIMALMSLAIFAAYMTYIILGPGMQQSISATYKVVPRSLFTFFMLAFPMPLLYAAMNINLPILSKLLFFFASVLIMMCGVADHTTDKRTEVIHWIGATGGIVLAMAAFCIVGGWYLILPVIGGIFTLYCTKFNGKWVEVRNHTAWIEMLFFALTVGGILAKAIL